MPFLSGFETDLFISYSSIDDQSLPGQNGWISGFRDALRIRLAQLLGVEPSIHTNHQSRDAATVRNQALGYREAGDLMCRLGQIDGAKKKYRDSLEILAKFLDKESSNLRESDKSGLASDMTSLQFKLSTLPKAQTSKQDSESLMKMFPLVFLPRFDKVGVWDFKTLRAAEGQ